jgi:hypothetical protein
MLRRILMFALHALRCAFGAVLDPVHTLDEGTETICGRDFMIGDAVSRRWLLDSSWVE